MSKKTLQKICLGIESTAHTFGVGIVDFKGNVLSRINAMYKPDEGGLHPRKVVEHHNIVFMNVIQKALNEANLSIKEIDLISFSQGPGLGPCLRIGAGIARSLSMKLKIPIIGVNHCIGHAEIGRRLSGYDDPLTVYASGGNTMIAGFQTGKYRVFGETLDIAIGNMIDMVARDLGVPHPGGPKIEKMAKKGTQYLPMPYIVKGMDLSFSGLYTTCKKLIDSPDFGKKYTPEDIAFSLQETAFAMLVEVTERAIAHTEKKEVMLTGGVAANKHLSDMIRYVSEEHGAKFYSVPLKHAGDNGVFIAWTGILYFLNSGGMTIEETIIDPKWRMDEVYVPWKLPNKKFSGMDYFKDNPGEIKITPRFEGSNIPNGSIKSSIGNLIIQRKGAEAELIKSKFFENDVMIKHRLRKKYRIPEIDLMIRNQRSINEARTIIRMKKIGIPTPQIFEIDTENASFTMTYLIGIRLKDAVTTLESSKLHEIFKKVGNIVAKMHINNQIHGDLTTSNIMLMDSTQEIYFIDFGLSFNSTTIEDKAVDLHLFKRVITSTHGEYYNDIFPLFIKGYLEEYGKENNNKKGKDIIKEIEDIELRGRYIKKDKRKRGKIKGK